MVALDHARKPTALGGAADIDQLSDREGFDADGFAQLQARQLLRRHLKFLKHGSRFHACLGQMARLRLGYAIGAPLAIGDLHRGIAIGFLGLDLGDAIVGDIEHGHRHGSAVVGENPCHADLAAHKS